jgi:hypothetical protein
MYTPPETIVRIIRTISIILLTFPDLFGIRVNKNTQSEEMTGMSVMVNDATRQIALSAFEGYVKFQPRQWSPPKMKPKMGRMIMKLRKDSFSI